jgi:hypothetical protein
MTIVILKAVPTGLEGIAVVYFNDAYLKGIAIQSGIDSNKKDRKQV